jgi:hypothetical protein
MNNAPTEEQIEQAWMTLKAAGIYPLLSIRVDEIIDASENTVTEEQAHKAAEEVQSFWDVGDAWQAAIEYSVNEAQGWKDEQ